ncbi:hypothetical protein ACQV5M_20320, partial [Leptospira sp. SA-E8]|uniref:hypothetical protein n=1 Tax=Leptospira sp. SA-E8 TaxID=3422259 RepID=UPI003EBB1410
MNGENLKSRLAVGILAHLGRHQWIARNQEEYVAIASRLASDIPMLNTTRLGLRDEVEKSVLMREDVFAQEFGTALRLMWMLWLARTEHPDWNEEQVLGQVQDWSGQPPAPAQQDFLIGVSPGERISLLHAYERLQELLRAALATPPTGDASSPDSLVSTPQWSAVKLLAERILCAKPHDPAALTVLSELE